MLHCRTSVRAGCRVALDRAGTGCEVLPGRGRPEDYQGRAHSRAPVGCGARASSTAPGETPYDAPPGGGISPWLALDRFHKSDLE
jgi:hypothetical protein